MLARDWYYTQRRRLGLDSAVASIYDRHDVVLTPTLSLFALDTFSLLER